MQSLIGLFRFAAGILIGFAYFEAMMMAGRGSSDELRAEAVAAGILTATTIGLYARQKKRTFPPTPGKVTSLAEFFDRANTHASLTKLIVTNSIMSLVALFFIFTTVLMLIAGKDSEHILPKLLLLSLLLGLFMTLGLYQLYRKIWFGKRE